LVARLVPKPERRSVGVIFFPGDLAPEVGGTFSTSARRQRVALAIGRVLRKKVFSGL
jgi:hypothetical protein